jgi:hypothetical protein
LLAAPIIPALRFDDAFGFGSGMELFEAETIVAFGASYN